MMKHQICEREAEVLQAARSGSLPSRLRQHADECRACAEALMVDGLLRSESQELPTLDHLPDPAIVWWRARQQARIRNTQRATLPIQLVERFALACGALGLAIGVSMSWTTVRSVVGRWFSSWAQQLASSVPSEGSAVLAALAGTILLLVIFGLYSQWAEG